MPNQCRRCNECTLCCRLLPVSEFNKPANQRCTHQRAGKGCVIHASPTYPDSCRIWSCGWLIYADAQHLPRPDRAHYVIDPVPDFVLIDKHDGSPLLRLRVVQIWVDPKHPQAHEDPALRTWLEHRARREPLAAIIRYSSSDSFVLFPPSLTPDKTWQKSHGIDGMEHTAREKFGALMSTTQCEEAVGRALREEASNR